MNSEGNRIELWQPIDLLMKNSDINDIKLLDIKLLIKKIISQN